MIQDIHDGSHDASYKAPDDLSNNNDTNDNDSYEAGGVKSDVKEEFINTISTSGFLTSMITSSSNSIKEDNQEVSNKANNNTSKTLDNVESKVKKIYFKTPDKSLEKRQDNQEVNNKENNNTSKTLDNADFNGGKKTPPFNMLKTMKGLFSKSLEKTQDRFSKKLNETGAKISNYFIETVTEDMPTLANKAEEASTKITNTFDNTSNDVNETVDKDIK